MYELEGDLFTRHLDPKDVAAIFVEPIQGEGGYLFPPDGFMKALRELCDTHGILLVADEIQCGVGRTGQMWACEQDGIEPDILLSAKGLGSGMPIGAFIAKENIDDWKGGAHGSTFGGNPVCCAAAIATLDLVEGGLMANAAKLGRSPDHRRAEARRASPDHRRRARPRTDGRHGTGEGSHDEGAESGSIPRAWSTPRSSMACCC